MGLYSRLLSSKTARGVVLHPLFRCVEKLPPGGSGRESRGREPLPQHSILSKARETLVIKAFEGLGFISALWVLEGIRVHIGFRD